MNIKSLIEAEIRGCFDYFWNESDADPQSVTYGLTRDRAPGRPDMASVAATGYALAALPIGTERGFVPRAAAEERAIGALRTLLYNTAKEHGFLYHFIMLGTGARYRFCEASVIDTAIAVCGALTAGAYFGGGTMTLARELYETVEWPWYTHHKGGRSLFSMGYKPEQGFWGEWDEYAEQFMMYFLGAASPSHPVTPRMFYDFERSVSAYGGHGDIVYCSSGSLFVYQFSHAFFDLRGLVDEKGTDWWENSVRATLANRGYCRKNGSRFQTFDKGLWGLTACDGPDGYNGAYGAQPRLRDEHNDGTVAVCAAAGSFPFAQDECGDVLLRMRLDYPDLWGRYGFWDSINLENGLWVAGDCIGIDKGISLLMLENHLTGMVWDGFMNIPETRKALDLCGLVKLEKTVDNYAGVMV